MNSKQVKVLVAQIESDDFDEESWRRILNEYSLGTRSRLLKKYRSMLQRALLRSPMMDPDVLEQRAGLDRDSWIELGKNPLAPFWLEDPTSPGAKLLLQAIVVDFFNLTRSLPKLKTNALITKRFLHLSSILLQPPWSDLFGKTIGWLNMKESWETDQPIAQEKLVMWLNGIPDQIMRTQLPDGTKTLHLRDLIRVIAEVFEVAMPPTVLDFLNEEAP